MPYANGPSTLHRHGGGFIQRRLLCGVVTIVRWPRLTLLICALVLAACTGLAAWKLQISTDQNRLFSPKVPFFRDYLAFIQKFPENEAIYILLEPRDPAHPPPVSRWTDAADAVADRLRKIPEHVQSVDERIPLDQLGRQGILFEDPKRLPKTLEETKRFIPLVKLWAEPPNLVTRVLGRTPIARFIGGLSAQPPNEQTATFLNLVAQSWVQTLRRPTTQPLAPGDGLPDLQSLDASDPSRLGYYYVPDESDRSQHLLLVRVYPRRDFTSLTAISDTVDSIRNTASDIVAKDFPEFTAGVTGRPALEADEMRTTDRDSHRAEAVALACVFVGLVVVLRSFWLALAAEIALGFGIGWTFGWATLSVGSLNLLSIVFLIALIGIGMDYLVQVLTRYREERQKRQRAEGIWMRVFYHVGPPINTACLGAAGAFLVSIFTDFRGAAELGIIAGGGLLLCLIAGYIVLPAMLAIWPVKPLKNVGRDWSQRRVFPLASRWRFVFPIVWIAAMGAMSPFMLRAEFDPGLLNLQAQNLPSVRLVRKLQTWFAVALSKDLGTLRAARAAVQDAPTVANTDSILLAYDNARWLREHTSELPKVNWTTPTNVEPTDLKSLADAAENLAKRYEGFDAARTLRDFAALLNEAIKDPRAASDTVQRLSAWQSAFLAQLREMLAQFQPQEVDLARLPAELRNHYVAADGTFALYINPKGDLWQRPALHAFVRDVEHRLAGVKGGMTVTGIAPNVFHSTSRIERSFYSATAYALMWIFLLVALDLRKLGQTLIAVSVLAFGLPMLIGLMGLLNISWNFANFFGLPILIGAGHEYGVFMIHRYLEARRDRRRAWIGWDVSDKALLLCAYVTCTSFAWFWIIANHLGLRSLGLVMALGTACIYAATIMVVRPLLKWHLARLGIPTTPPQSEGFSPLPSPAPGEGEGQAAPEYARR
jgi:predicted RND superfamily exporter protein